MEFVDGKLKIVSEGWYFDYFVKLENENFVR